MKITSVTAWIVPLTSHEIYYMAGGKTCGTVDTVVVRVDTDDGIIGWGEVCPIPHYLAAYANGVIPAIEEMMPILLGADPIGPEALMYKLDQHLIGHDYAKSAIDTALWDITSKAANLPLYALLGGRQAKDMPLYHSITCVGPSEMARIATEAYAIGMRQFQVKLGADNNWETDVARLTLVREAVGNGPVVYGDWNNSGTQLDCTRTARSVEHLDIMLEAPCPTIEECAAVRASSGLPMKMDELAFDTASLLQAHKMGIMDAVALKLSKFGGLSAMRRARDLCMHLGARMCIEDTWGSDITTGALLHLAASTAPRNLLNTCDLSGYVSPRIDVGAPMRESGRIKPPTGVGHGISPNVEILGQEAARFD